MTYIILFFLIVFVIIVIVVSSSSISKFGPVTHTEGDPISADTPAYFFYFFGCSNISFYAYMEAVITQ
jgi:hypothetical protein